MQHASRSRAKCVALVLPGWIVLWPRLVLAAGGAKATPLENVADTRDLAPGFSKFLADTYNGNMWLYAAYAVGIMVVMGLVLGLVADKLMGLTGISLGKADHHE
ncbi:MAG: hypothetical protein JW940_16515 [Polyangiaceae bacterium]|nr:hypothetical protein [Polyangiaceae bacterium]